MGSNPTARTKTMFSYHYAYLLGNLLILLPVWVFIFRWRKDLRKEILIVSLVAGIIGPISELYYLKDYWRPEIFTGWPVGIEDFLFGFFIGGISSVIYEEIFGKKHSKRTNRDHHWSWFIIPISALFILVLNALFFIFNINSIYVSLVAFFLITLVILCFRRDLWIDSIMSGVLMGLVMFFSYLVFLTIFPEAIHRWWLLNNISGILINGIPAEELLWAFGLGMVCGPIYEFFTGLREH